MLTGTHSFSQGVHWMSFTEAVRQNEKSPRKILIDVYARWCSNCKKMDATTFVDSSVAAYINSHYYPVKLDAETRDSILYRGQVFVYNPTTKVNELAGILIGNEPSYPNFAFLDDQLSLITNIIGYQAPEEFKPILVYFSEDKYKTQTWDEFQKQGSTK
jgi:thioredoxin-related protein